jgi:hypothetical protein
VFSIVTTEFYLLTYCGIHLIYTKKSRTALRQTFVEDAVGICGSKFQGKDEYCQAEGTMPNGRCRKHYRRTESNRNTANRRYDGKRAAGEPLRFYELTEERREAFRNARVGKCWPQEVKDAIGAGRRKAHRERRDREALDHSLADINAITGMRAPKFEMPELSA